MPNSTNQPFRIDWKRLDLGDVITILTVLVGLGMAYADVKSDIRANKVETTTKFEAYDKQIEAQKRIDQEQNERTMRVYTDLQGAIKDLKTDLRADLKDIKTDMAIRRAGR